MWFLRDERCERSARELGCCVDGWFGIGDVVVRLTSVQGAGAGAGAGVMGCPNRQLAFYIVRTEICANRCAELIKPLRACVYSLKYFMQVHL